MLVIKSTPNEVNAVIIFEIDETEKTFTIEYTYDNDNIKYNELLNREETQNKVNELREKGYKGNVKNSN